MLRLKENDIAKTHIISNHCNTVDRRHLHCQHTSTRSTSHTNKSLRWLRMTRSTSPRMVLLKILYPRINAFLRSGDGVHHLPAKNESHTVFKQWLEIHGSPNKITDFTAAVGVNNWYLPRRGKNARKKASRSAQRSWLRDKRGAMSVLLLCNTCAPFPY